MTATFSGSRNSACHRSRLGPVVAFYRNHCPYPPAYDYLTGGYLGLCLCTHFLSFTLGSDLLANLLASFFSYLAHIFGVIAKHLPLFWFCFVWVSFVMSLPSVITQTDVSQSVVLYGHVDFVIRRFYERENRPHLPL